MIAEMGGYAEKSVVDSIDALIKRDVTLAQSVTERLRHSQEVRRLYLGEEFRL